MTDFAFLMPVIFIFAGMHGARTLLGDGDTGWHVRTGEWILSHRSIPYKDLFSYTKTGGTWFAWEWLWDVIFAWLHQHWGMAAVVTGSLFVISLTSAMVFRLANHKCGNPLIAMAVTFLAIAGSSIHFLARPHLTTLLFVVIFYSILERIREQQRLRLLWWLPALTVVWTNLHGGFFLGIVLCGLYALGDLAGVLFRQQENSWAQAFRSAVPYAAAGAGCLAASFVGPYTYHLHQHILSYLTDSFQREHIMEMLPISFQNPAARYFEILLLGCGAAVLWHVRKLRVTECLILVFFGHLGLIASRNIPIFGIVAAPVVALAIAEWIHMLEDASVAGWLRRMAHGLSETGASMHKMELLPRLHLVSAAGIALVVAIFYAPSPPVKFRAVFDPKDFPAKAVASMGGAEMQGRIFTSDQWGDFLIYKYFPKSQVFIDGRSDFYGSKFVGQYLDIVNVKHTWQRHLDSYGVDTVLIQADAALAGALKESSRWHVVYDDGMAIVFRASGARTDGRQVSAAESGGKDSAQKVMPSGSPDQITNKTTT